jgi:hypothetical protein
MCANSDPVGDGFRICARVAHCPVCGELNGCRLETGEAYKGPCWCEFPTLASHTLKRLLEELPVPRCLCSRCLPAIAENPDLSWQELAARNAAPAPSPVIEGDSYLENGFVVFTAQYHLRRGYCCGNGCRHCPYPKDHAQ